VTAERPDDPPFVDAHRVLVDAPAGDVWRALAAQLVGFTNGTLAGVLGTEPRRATGRLPEAGATLPGFAVTEAVPDRRLRLAGRHRFSRYVLGFDLAAQPPDATVLTARTYAEFPGVAGALYRRAVIGSGAHRLLVVRLLRAVRRRAERAR